MHTSFLKLSRNLARILATLIAATPLLVLCTTPPAFADGMVVSIPPDYRDQDVTYHTEASQDALIAYENGMQKMILSIGFEHSGNSDAVWIFPVPAEPDRIAIDILRDMPRVTGDEISGLARENLDAIHHGMLATQLYPLIFMPSAGGNLSNRVGATPDADFQSTENMGGGVVVHEHIEREGITTELITARTAGAIYEYLSDKGLDLDEGSIPVLETYIGEEFSFVTSWIGYGDSTYRYNQATVGTRGVYVTFPTDRIYYPLIPTSVYDSKIVPATIRVIGHVTPDLYPDIVNYTYTAYYINGHYTAPSPPPDFYTGGTRGNIREFVYTKIDLTSPSKFLTEDLWMRPGVPPGKAFALLTATHPIPTGIFLALVASLLAGLIAGIITLRKTGMKPWTYTILGLANLLSIIGLIIAVSFVRTGPLPDSKNKIIDELRNKGYFSRRFVGFLLFFYSAIFFIYGFIIVPLTYHHPDFDLMEVLYLYVIPVIAFMLGIMLFRVDKEDRPLFKEIKQGGWGATMLLAANWSKVLYVVVFMVAFPILTMLLRFLTGAMAS